MIKRIELINFMSHAHTVIEPAAGLTVLVGPNNCGKSALVAALQILCHNDNSTYVLRHRATECRVIVETADGHEIEWSRKKSGSTRYTIDGKSFDRLKRSVPPELHAALRLPKVTSDKQEFDVHFGEQKRPVFLLNDSAGAAAEFFASSSDAIRLVEMQALHKQKVRDARRDQSNLLQEKQGLAARLEILAPVQKLDGSVRAAEEQFVRLGIAAEEIAAIDKTIVRIVECHKSLLFRESLVDCFDDLAAPPDFQNTRELENLRQQLAVTWRDSDRSNELSIALADLAPPPALDDVSDLEKLICQLASSARRAQRDESKSKLLHQLSPAPELEPLGPLEELISNFARQQQVVVRLNRQLEGITSDLVRVEHDICEWATANPICPTCKGPVAVGNLIPGFEEIGGGGP